jgi:hypothetical protein
MDVRKKVFLLAGIIFLLCFAGSAISVEFWGSKNSNKYHYPNCVWALKINKSNLIIFNSPEEARNAGYIPCKVCKPPIASAENPDKYAMNKVERGRGCCSWHGGVCGCINGRVLCCDGTLSPTCRCNE